MEMTGRKKRSYGIAGILTMVALAVSAGVARPQVPAPPNVDDWIERARGTGGSGGSSGASARRPPFRFAVLGDFGTGSRAEYAVARRMCARHRRRPYGVVLTTGDNIYPNGSPSLFRPHFFRPFRCLFQRGVKFHASLGNHDILTDNGRPEIEHPRFGMRGRNYALSVGPVRVVIADSNSLDIPWLRRTLRRRTRDRWTVVAFHHPVYSSGTGHGSTPGFQHLPRIFRRHGVDLVLNGHDHVYTVTKPLRGIRYVVTGGGGAPLYGCRARWFTDVCLPRHHFLAVAAYADRVVVRAISQSGRTLDVFATRGIRRS